MKTHPLFLVIDRNSNLINIWVEEHLIIPYSPPIVFPVTTGFLRERLEIQLASQVKCELQVMITLFSALALILSPKYLCSNKSGLISKHDDDKRRELRPAANHQKCILDLYILYVAVRFNY